MGPAKEPHGTTEVGWKVQSGREKSLPSQMPPEGTSEVVLAAHGRSPAKVAGEVYNEWLLAEIGRGADNKALFWQEVQKDLLLAGIERLADQ